MVHSLNWSSQGNQVAHGWVMEFTWSVVQGEVSMVRWFMVEEWLGQVAHGPRDEVKSGVRWSIVQGIRWFRFCGWIRRSVVHALGGQVVNGLGELGMGFRWSMVRGSPGVDPELLLGGGTNP